MRAPRRMVAPLLLPAGPARVARPLRAGCVLLALAAIALACGFACTPAALAAPLAATRAEITAAMVLKFAGFVNWHAPLGDTLRVVVAGDDDVRLALQELAEKHNRAVSPDEGAAPGLPRLLIITAARTPADVAGCHVLYVGERMRTNGGLYIKQAHANGALTVTAMDPAEPSAVIRLFREGNRMRFAVDQAAAQTAQLKISSQLLNMARPTTSVLVVAQPWFEMG